MFEDQTYILEPMKNATDRYKLLPAKNLTSIWGSCGSHHNTSGQASYNSSPAFSQTRTRRVRGKSNSCFWGIWGLHLWAPVPGELEKLCPWIFCLGPANSHSSEGGEHHGADHNHRLNSASLSQMSASDSLKSSDKFTLSGSGDDKVTIYHIF